MGYVDSWVRRLSLGIPLPIRALQRTRARSSLDPHIKMDQQIRVLYIDYSIGFGGAVKSLALTMRGLQGVDKFILTSQDPEIVSAWFPEEQVMSFRRLINYRTSSRLVSRFHGRILQTAALKLMAVADVLVTWKNFLRVFAFLKRQQIDIIHLNNGFLPREGLLAARAACIPCIVHLRDFQREPRTLDSLVLQTVAKVITVSDAVGASLNNSPIPSSVRRTVYDPVDLQRMHDGALARDVIRKEWGARPTDILVGIFGRVIPWKGQKEFVEAVALAMAHEQNIRAVIVGDQSDGDELYFRQVRDCIDSSGLASRFFLAGYRVNVEEYYAAVDIVVHASITPEPFGMVIPEAMAAGRAVIAMDAGGPRETIEHGIDGLLSPPSDVGALAQAILRIASDSVLRRSMGTAGRRKAETTFGIEANAAQMISIYREVLAPTLKPE
jgi:glycosyltransferase involved in cell wall biosynthesis